ncbi:TIGR00725 family protein [Chloroflexota bacterium]
MRLRDQKFIAVIGGGQCSKQEARLAEEVGAEIAGRGAVLVCGGLGGVMTAACKGARSAGGMTVGILPKNKRNDANPYVDFPIVTGIGEARNVIVVNSSHAVIAVDGKFGTLSEIAYALRNKIPVIGLDTWALSKKGKADKSIIIARDAKDAVDKALAAIKT